MQELYIAPTNETPEIRFDFGSHRLEMRGESYPENAMAFYAPLRASLADYLPQVPDGQTVEANFALSYFNSSSTKLIRSLLAMMHDAANKGTRTVVRWHHDPEDDMMMEFGNDLRDEFRMMDIQVLSTVAN